MVEKAPAPKSKGTSSSLPLLQNPEAQHLRNVEQELGGDGRVALDQLAERGFAEAEQPDTVGGRVTYWAVERLPGDILRLENFRTSVSQNEDEGRVAK